MIKRVRNPSVLPQETNQTNLCPQAGKHPPCIRVENLIFTLKFLCRVDVLELHRMSMLTNELEKSDYVIVPLNTPAGMCLNVLQYNPKHAYSEASSVDLTL